MPDQSGFWLINKIRQVFHRRHVPVIAVTGHPFPFEGVRRAGFDDVMVRGKTKAYKEQSFDNLRGLDGISEDQIVEHLKLYAGYVKQVNSLNQELAELLSKGRASGKDPAFAELTRRLGFEYNGMSTGAVGPCPVPTAPGSTPPSASCARRSGARRPSQSRSGRAAGPWVLSTLASPRGDRSSIG